jgi:pimeloyl-ACP methyl ester carboxylesterase
MSRRSLLNALLPSLFALGLVGCATAPEPLAEAAPAAAACPEGVPAAAKCWRGVDSAKAPYLIVMPEKWSGVLVVHAHGGPFLGEPTAARADADIKRWAITVREGHAWAGSVFRQGGFAVTTAAEDTERVRRIFVTHVAKPKTTLLHGQSWGAMVATRAAELFPQSWDGMLLTSGVVAGPTTYDFRLDLRAIYQHLCGNHPKADELAYPLAIGLPADAKLTTADVAARADECLGVRKPAAQRTPEQASKLKTIVDVVRIPESAVIGHLNWGTFTLRDVVQRHGGTSPFGNAGVRYRGSTDDVALNAAVPRFVVDATAARRFAADVDHQGRFAMPVLSTHGVGDSTVFAEGSDTLRQRMQAQGKAGQLVQTFVQSNEHSYLGDATYPPLFEALLNWVEKGQKPTSAGIAQRCAGMPGAKAEECRFLPGHMVQPLASRIPPR